MDGEWPPLRTPLDPVETSVLPPAIAPDPAFDWRVDLELSFRHSGWHARRQRIHAAMKAASVSPGRLARFAGCGCGAWVEQSLSDPDEFHVVANYCHDRWCVPCALDRGRRIAAAVIERLADKPARFVTLTLRNQTGPLQPQLDRLLSCFKRLRRTAFWRTHVEGGAWFLEVTRNTECGTWHPHVHVICQGRYIPHADLKSEWLRVTGDSFIVDVQYVKSQNHVAHYVTTYVTKPIGNTHLADDAALLDAIASMTHRRLWGTFGTWHSLKTEPPKGTTVWVPKCPLYEVLLAAKEGQPQACKILESLRKAHRWNQPPPGPSP